MAPVAALLAMLAACRQGGGIVPLGVEAVPAYAAPSAPWPPAVAATRFGRGVAPVRAAPAAIGWGGVAAPPIEEARVWPVPEDAEERAVVWGRLGGAVAVEVIAIDPGRIRWRTSTKCPGGVVHVATDVIVCGEAERMVGLAVESGEVTWEQAGAFAAGDAERVVARRKGAVAVIDVHTGAVLAEAAPPEGVAAESVRAACPAAEGFVMWAWDAGLAHYTLARGGAVGARVAIDVPFAPVDVEPCVIPAIVELPIEGSVESTLYAIGAEGLVQPGIVARAHWRDYDDRVFAATALGIERLDGNLASVELMSDAQVGREIGSRAAFRLVLGAGDRPVLLNGEVPVATLSAPADGSRVALGESYVLGGHGVVSRFQMPALGATEDIDPRYVEDPPPVPLETLDLPPETELAATSIEVGELGAVARVLVDPTDPAIVYVAAGTAIAAFDARARAWTWQVADACPSAAIVGIAVSTDSILCGTRDGAMRAIGRDGAPRWDWRGAAIDQIAAAGGLAVITTASRAIVLDTRTGDPLGGLPADDGAAPRVVPFALDEVDVIVAVERGQVVARLPRARMLPLWAAAVDGVVLALGVAGGRITAELAGGELYFLDAATGAATAAGGWARRWAALDGSDVVLAEPVIPTGAEWPVTAYGPDGVPRFAALLSVPGPWLPGARGRDPASAIAVAYGPGARAAALLDPGTGRVRARATLPPRAAPGALFTTVVDGAPVAGVVVAAPVGIALFPP